jgi:hypothetical protein
MIDHERCSELLPAFVDGTLEAFEVTEVGEHLASCSECSAELRALRVLKAPIQPLSEFEASSVRKAVLAEITSARTGRRPLTARLAPYLGAAALLMVVAVGIVSMNVGGSDDESGADRGSTQAGDDADGGGAPAAESAPGTLQDSSSSEALSASGPLFFDGGRTSLRELKALGRRGYLAQVAATFASSKASNKDVDEDTEAGGSDLRESERSALLGELIAAAGRAGDAVDACGTRALGDLDGSALPVYGAATRLDKERVLVMGFLIESGGSYSRYSIWVFPRASCDEPTEVIEGQIAR